MRGRLAAVLVAGALWAGVGDALAGPSRVAAPIDVHLVDAEIGNVLRLIGEVAQLDFVYDPERVRGRVTVRLRGVPWDRALRAILRSKQLELRWEGEKIVRIVPRAERGATGRRGAEPRGRCPRAAPLQTRLVRLRHARAEALAPLVRMTLRSKRGTVAVDRRTNTLIVRDTNCRTP